MEAFSQDVKKVPVLRGLLPFSGGVLLLQVATLQTRSMLLLVLFLVLVFFLGLTMEKGKIISSLVLIALFIVSGLFLSSTYVKENELSPGEAEVLIKGEVIGLPSKKPGSVSFPFRVQYVSSDELQMKTKLKIMAYMKNDSTCIDVRPGEEWIFLGRLNKITNRGNPGEFNYQSYMERKGISYMFFAGEECRQLISNTDVKKLRYLPLKARDRIASRWDPEDKDHQVLKALTLGDKKNMDQETRTSFSIAGAMHLLAVSGLHVGMIWMILDKVLSVFARNRLLRLLKTVLLIFILWFYAAITGFSESVTRSVTMFSLVSFSAGIGRKSNIFNTIFLSAFILLAIHPARIYDAGFQLSYVAVFGIVTIQPLVEKMISPKNKLLKYFCDLISVSIAATMITLPLTLLYFHQFSAYFILSNIVAIPLVSLILLGFVLASPVLLISGAPGFLDLLLIKLTHVLNTAIGFISALPAARVSCIPMIPAVSVLLLCMILCLLAFFHYRKVDFLFGTMILASAMLTVSGFYWSDQKNVEEVRIYNQSKCMLLSSRDGMRERIYYLPVDSLDHYAKEYMRIFRQKPGRYPDPEYIDISLDSSEKESFTLLSEGLWVLSQQNMRILIIGSCRGYIVREVLGSARWDMVIFTRGFPRYADVYKESSGNLLCIGDGTLTFGERSFLENSFGNLYLVQDRGSCTFSELSE